MHKEKALKATVVALLALAFIIARSETEQPLAFSQATRLDSTSLEATVYVDPSVTTAEVCQEFSVNVSISNVTDLYGWEFKLKWNSTLLDVLNITEGDFLKSYDDTFFVINMTNTEGYVRAACTLIGSIPGVNGSGTLATVEFKSENEGESSLDIYDTKLVSSLEQAIPHDSVDGYGYFTLAHDLAVTSILASPVKVLPGQLVHINVTVQNRGAYDESFNVTTCYDSVFIETQSISLSSGSSANLSFVWDTTDVEKGDYAVSAEASVVAGEIETTNNVKTSDDMITVLSSEHDVAITSVIPSKTIIGLGYSLFINTSAKNYGVFVETFNITAYYHDITIETKIVTYLASGEETTLTFMWNTTSAAKGNYTITAAADPIPSEPDTTDNILTDGWVIVSMIGDIAGPDGYPDGKCDIRDIAAVAKLYGINHPDPKYDPNCDLTGPTSGLADGKIDIRDIATVAKHYGEIDP